MKLKTAVLGLALAIALSSPVFASGLFQNLPASTSSGTPSTTGLTTGGQAITGSECIPADTGNTQGVNPATMCISPSQLSNYDGSLNTTSAYSTVPIGSVAYASFGNDTTYVSGTVYLAQLQIPRNMTITNINCLSGATVGTNKVIYALFNSTGTLVANTALAGATTSGANAFQTIALTSTYAATKGGYWIGVQANGATDGVRTIAASTFINVFTKSSTGVFGTIPAQTVPTTFTANVGPICYVN